MQIGLKIKITGQPNISGLGLGVGQFKKSSWKRQQRGKIGNS